MQTPNKKIAILVSDNLFPGSKNQRKDIFELDEELGKLQPAFAEQGMDIVIVKWREAAAQAQEFDAALPLFVWDYFEENEKEFFAAMAKLCQNTKLYNTFDILKWNADKNYLEELGAQGASIIPTIAVEKISKRNVARAMEAFSVNKIVIKPVVGGGAWRQVLYEEGNVFPNKDELPPQGALIQPFLKSVEQEGEYSFLYFGGGFSHALIKKPKSGDYRVQSIYGGSEKAYEPTKSERAQARAILNVLEFTPLYARVDLLRGDDGRLLLIELEMIEPYLHLPFAGGEGGENKGAQKLAKALHKKLNKKDL